MIDVPCSGNGDLTYHEARSHWTAWALMKSPLLIGTNVRMDLFRGFCYVT